VAPLNIRRDTNTKHKHFGGSYYENDGIIRLERSTPNPHNYAVFVSIGLFYFYVTDKP